jgi:hypothetical protein
MESVNVVEKEFHQIYIEDSNLFLRFKDLKGNNTLSLYLYIVEKLCDKENMFYFDMFTHEEFKKATNDMNIARNTTNACINELLRHDLIIKYSRCRFQVNPEVIWKGKVKDMYKAIRMYKKQEQLNLNKQNNQNEKVQEKTSSN